MNAIAPTQMQFHPLCTLFPSLEGAEFRALCDDVRANGLRQPIVVHDDMILDGGNRYRACLEAGVAPRLVNFDGANLISFVLSANLHRRHMTPGQQAAIVASATDWANAQRHGGSRKAGQGEALNLETVAKRAAASGATPRTQKDADRLVREAPALAKQVTQGKKSLYAAVRESKPLPKILSRRDVPPKPAAKPTHERDADELLARIASLEADLEAARANAAELADSLQGYVSAQQGVKEAAAEIKRLLGMVRVLEATRDQYMTKCAEMAKSMKWLQRRLEKKP